MKAEGEVLAKDSLRGTCSSHNWSARQQGRGDNLR